jgi:hypothetical protein
VVGVRDAGRLDHFTAGVPMKIFGERELRDFLGEQLDTLQREVHSEDKNRLLNMNETEYVNYLVNRYQIEPLVLHWDSQGISDREEMIPAERFPPLFNVYRGKRYPKQVITYHIPYSGERELLRCNPSSIGWITIDVSLEGGCVCFGVINWRDDAEQVKGEANSILDKIRKQVEKVATQVKGYNNTLEDKARQVVQARKALLLKQANLMASLGVPFFKAEQVPSTFAVPTVAKRVVVKPSAPSTPFSPDYTLDPSLYYDILRIIHETGIEMERLPSIYRNKDEPTLRDYLIMVLSPNFQSVTGETFNKTGKTDILIRHEKANVFVAECEFWKGIKAFFKTIDQALGYLTWRDSKAAIVCFIRNKKLNPVLKQIETKTASHPCFVKYHGKKAESWFSFEFHLKDDETRGVQLAVLCFHFPSSEPLAASDGGD